MIRRALVSFTAAALLTASGAAAGPVGSAFTYQGQLKASGQPATGLYDVRFQLFDAPEAGTLVSSADYTGVQVAGGLFTQQVDLGAGVFNGNARWLQISVRRAGSGEAFTTLLPRQAMTGTPYAQGLALPFAGDTSAATPLMGLTQRGSGNAVSGTILGGAGTAVYAQTSGNGKAMMGYHLGADGNAAFFRTESINNDADAVRVEQNGLGNGVYASSRMGNAGFFEISNAANNSSALVAKNGGAGPSLQGWAWGSGRAVYALTTGTGYGVYAYAQSSANAVAGYFAHAASGTAIRAATGGTGTTIEASHAGSGTTIRANGGSGTSVHATASAGGTALRAGAGTSGTALRIDNGAIKVAGAGVGTPTAAFRHVTTDANLHGCYLGFCHRSTIDHPMCNNNPNALLIITERVKGTSTGRTAPVAVQYDNASGRWELYTQGDLYTSSEDFDEGEEFNILVIVP